MAAGQIFNKNGMRWTSYDETSDGAAQLIDDYFVSEETIRRSTGDIGYGRYNTMDHMFRPVFGKELQAAFMTTNSVQAMIGSKAYGTEGMRLVMSKNSYQMGSDFKTPFSNASIFASKFAGKHLGVGAATVQDGRIPGGNMIQPDLLHIPYKEITEDYKYPLGLEALESHGDDVGAKADYVNLMSDFFSDAIDKTILRPITDYQPSTTMFDSNASWGISDSMAAETSLNGIARIFSSGTEVGKTYKDASGNDVTIMPSMVCPWGGLSGDMGKTNPMTTYGQTSSYGRRLKGLTFGSGTGDLEAFDSNGALVYNSTYALGSDPHEKNNWDAQVMNLNNQSVTLENIFKLHTMCKQNRDGMSDESSFFIMSPMFWNKVNMLNLANRVYQTVPEAYRSIGVGGMQGVKGQDMGISFVTLQNQPVMVSQNLGFDYATEQPSEACFGDLYDIDGKHLFMSLLTPLDLWNFKNPIVTYDFQERNLFHIREELRADKFVSSGRITNVANA